MSQKYSGGIITANPTTPTTTSASGVWTLEQQFQNSANWPGSLQLASRSVRVRSSATAYLTRTPASATNQKTFTLSFWIKRGALTGDQTVFGVRAVSTSLPYWYLSFYNADNTFHLDSNVGGSFGTSQTFRDISAWYHIVLAVDTTQAVSSNRLKLYINGSQVTAFSAISYPALNADTGMNSTTPQWFGCVTNGAGVILQYSDVYFSEIKVVDGQALDASYFGTTDSNGVWQPVAYSGAYGTNGYYLNFSDNSAATAATLGKDYSGNGNNFTPTNISVTAGVTYDSMLDVPTNYSDGGNGRGNYPVWNVLKRYTANFGFSNGNLTVTDASASATGAAATMRTPASGKWYWEITTTTISGILGYVLATTESNADGSLVAGNLGSYRSNGGIANLAGTAQTSGATYTNGDVIGVAVDVDNGTVQFYKNGTAQGATPSFTFTAGTILVPAVATDNSAGTKTFNANFGQRPFNSTPPTGFVALNTQNLPDATINEGNQYFDATIYTGDGTSSKVIVNSGPMQPDMVWLKVRNTADNHSIADSVRGAPALIQTNTNAAEIAAPLQGSVGSFNSNGFTIAAGATNNANYNTNGNTYVAWQWNAGGSTVSNTNGSITSSVRANPTAGFSIVTYTGTGANATVGHGLGVAPKMIIIKARSRIDDWIVYHESVGNTKYLLLDTTAAASALSTAAWNNTSPTSTVFTIGTQSNGNTASSTNVAYCFSEVAGFSKFGSYTGNGAADGPFAYCGFRPRFLMIKRTDAVGNWVMIDTARSPYNEGGAAVWANLTTAESANSGMDVVANGFKLKNNTGTDVNASASTYIFMAFAENPFKLSRAR